LLAYGRKQESEADEMGLYLMAMAGYDPERQLLSGKEWNLLLQAAELRNFYQHT
jgi:hypothetical protein